MLKQCPQCKTHFKTYPSVIKKGGGIFCSLSCKKELTLTEKFFPVTHQYLMSVLTYNKETGLFTWKVKPKYRPIKPGKRAGYVGHKGYRYITLNGKEYSEHRLAWFYVTGNWPRQQIDHIDTNKANNIWSNLREANGFQQQWNRPLGRTNTTGFKGVTGRQFANAYKYIAAIHYKGKFRHLGVFNTPEEAHERYCQEAKQLHGEFFNKG